MLIMYNVKSINTDRFINAACRKINLGTLMIKQKYVGQKIKTGEVRIKTAW